MAKSNGEPILNFNLKKSIDMQISMCSETEKGFWLHCFTHVYSCGQKFTYTDMDVMDDDTDLSGLFNSFKFHNVLPRPLNSLTVSDRDWLVASLCKT